MAVGRSRQPPANLRVVSTRPSGSAVQRHLDGLHGSVRDLQKDAWDINILEGIVVRSDTPTFVEHGLGHDWTRYWTVDSTDGGAPMSVDDRDHPRSRFIGLRLPAPSPDLAYGAIMRSVPDQGEVSFPTPRNIWVEVGASASVYTTSSLHAMAAHTGTLARRLGITSDGWYDLSYNMSFGSTATTPHFIRGKVFVTSSAGQVELNETTSRTISEDADGDNAILASRAIVHLTSGSQLQLMMITTTAPSHTASIAGCTVVARQLRMDTPTVTWTTCSLAVV